MPKRTYKEIDLSPYKHLFGFTILQFMGMLILVGLSITALYQLT